MRTTVVNIRVESCDVYIGRPSAWGNPFTVEEYGREEAIRQYTAWLFSDDPAALGLLSSVGQLKGKRLGCYCKPRPCHGDLLAELADAD